MNTKMSKSNFISSLKSNPLVKEIIETEEKIGFMLKNSPIYYYFEEKNNVIVSTYYYSMYTGKISDSYNRFWNVCYKLNLLNRN